MDVVFLDANVLFSAAWRADSGLKRLWSLPDIELVTSAYAVEEARRNLEDEDRRKRFGALLRRVRVVAEAPDLEATRRALPDDAPLPPDDLPILAAAIAAGATHLLTGDRRHFGELYGERVGGMRILKPASILD